MKFARRVGLFGAYGFISYVPANEAKRMHDMKIAVRVSQHDKSGYVDELTVIDYSPKRNHDRPGTNSLKAGYMETLSGGHHLRIESKTKDTRDVTTLPCRVYKLKRIDPLDRPIYQSSVLENLTQRRAS